MADDLDLIHRFVRNGQQAQQAVEVLVQAAVPTRLSRALAVLYAEHRGSDLAVARELSRRLGHPFKRVTVWRWRTGRHEPRWSMGEAICGLVMGLDEDGAGGS